MRNYKRKLIKISAMILSAVILFTSCKADTAVINVPRANIFTPSEKIVRTDDLRREVLLDHSLVAENDKWELFLKEETLSIIIRSKASGQYMTSTVTEPDEKDNANWKGFYQSGVTMEYIKGTNLDYTRADFINTANEKNITYLVDGFVAEVTFPEIMISYELTVKLTDTGFTAEIPQDTIKEGKSDEFTTGTFYIYPFLGNTLLGEENGYMIVPDGQGIIIDLEDKEGRYRQPFSSNIYGRNNGIDSYVYNEMTYEPYDIIIPVYGMVHTDKELGYLAIIESGDTSCKIEACPNGSATNFNWISSRFILRQVYAQPTGKTSGSVQMRTDRANRVDMKVRFEFAEGSDANYSGLAVRYRDYLEKNGAFSAVTDKEYRTQLDFFGLDQKKWVVFDIDVPMTTFEDASEIVNDLHDKGVGKMLIAFSGWQSGGFYNLPVKSFSPASKLGGKSGLKSLFNEYAENGDKLYLAETVRTINADKNPSELLNAMKRVTRETFRSWDGDYRVNPFRSLEITKNVIKDFEKVDNIGVQLYQHTYSLSSFTYNSTYYDRADNADIYNEITRLFSESMPTLLDQPYSYLWRHGDALTGIMTDGSSYIYTTKEIPFLSIVLSGKMPFYSTFINYHANASKEFLKMIEHGIRPAFQITKEDTSELVETRSNDIFTARYDLYVDRIVEYDKVMRDLYEKIDGSSIISHKYDESNANLSIVEYENGLKVYVNYGDNKAVYDNVEIEPMNYKVVI